jgi:hypothetical protein
MRERGVYGCVIETTEAAFGVSIKAKHKAVAERIKDVIATGDKVVVFTSFNDGVAKHAATQGNAAVIVSIKGASLT